MKKQLLILLFLFAIFISGDIVNDDLNNLLILEKNAFVFSDTYAEVIKGEGYIPDIDFKQMRLQYSGIIKKGNNNPFVYLAYGFTFHYTDNPDSAMYYFNIASEKAGLDYIIHMRMFELFRIHSVKEAIENELKQFVPIKYKLGAIAIPEAALFINIAALDEYYNRSNIKDAEKLLLYANQIDPFNMGIMYNFLKISLLNFRFENTALILKMLKNSFYDIFNRFCILYNILTFIRYFVFSLFIILTLLLFIKNINGIFYAFSNNLSKKLTLFQKRIIVIIIIFLPLILQINPLLWIFYISLINYIFIRRREKLVIGLLLIIIICMPIFFNVENHILGKMNVDDNLSVIVKANYYGWDSPLIEKIDKHIIEQPFTNSLFFAKALLYKKGGYFEKAEMEYNKILITGEESGEIYNNIGNLMYFMGLYSKAEEHYQKAIEISPKLPQPYYNLAQIYIDRLDLNESNDLMLKATRLNHDLINNFMENSVKGYYNTELIDCGVPEQYLWNEFVKRNQLASPPVIMGIKMDVIVFISLISLILSGIIGTLLKHKMKLRKCFTCGEIIFESKTKIFNEQKVCSKCFDILDSTISDTLRSRKYESMIRMTDKRKIKKIRIMSLVFPGAGRIIQGKFFKGNLNISLMVSLIILLFSDKIFIVRNPYVLNSIVFPNSIIIMIILIIIYISNIIIMRKGK